MPGPDRPRIRRSDRQQSIEGFLTETRCAQTQVLEVLTARWAWYRGQAAGGMVLVQDIAAADAGQEPVTGPDPELVTEPVPHRLPDEFSERLTARPGAAGDVEWKGSQLCWVCDERRKCRPDPDHPARWHEFADNCLTTTAVSYLLPSLLP